MFKESLKRECAPSIYIYIYIFKDIVIKTKKKIKKEPKKSSVARKNVQKNHQKYSNWEKNRKNDSSIFQDALSEKDYKKIVTYKKIKVKIIS